ncbi:hypothetical protein JG687_00017817 [Phytophthora cactorum]|uniref:Uncharacterized protein n=1 Tax=Phytophthora cactorum TaxID=29920 RepID=A0A8T1TQL0_9STRA|nr:hypothetical protein JG687_00017817 [Phytophthora cactorum]
MQSSWFKVSTFTRAPETLNATRKSVCIRREYQCTPQVKEYLQRTVHGVDHTTILYYARYSCQGTSKVSFSTVDDRYVSSSKQLLLAFPYLLPIRSRFLWP